MFTDKNNFVFLKSIHSLICLESKSNLNCIIENGQFLVNLYEDKKISKKFHANKN